MINTNENVGSYTGFFKLGTSVCLAWTGDNNNPFSQLRKNQTLHSHRAAHYHIQSDLILFLVNLCMYIEIAMRLYPPTDMDG